MDSVEEDGQLEKLAREVAKARSELKHIKQQNDSLRVQHKKDVRQIRDIIKKADFSQIGTPGLAGHAPDSLWNFKPIGHVRSVFKYKNGIPRQANVCETSKGSVTLERDLYSNPEHSLQGLEQYSHIWVIFLFHKNSNTFSKAKVAPPRLNGARVGLFSTRTPHRPNAVGLSLVKLDDVQGSTLHLSGVDLLDGTPVLDIKPYIPDYDMPHASPQTSAQVIDNHGEPAATSPQYAPVSDGEIMTDYHPTTVESEKSPSQPSVDTTSSAKNIDTTMYPPDTVTTSSLEHSIIREDGTDPSLCVIKELQNNSIHSASQTNDGLFKPGEGQVKSSQSSIEKSNQNSMEKTCSGLTQPIYPATREDAVSDCDSGTNTTSSLSSTSQGTAGETHTTQTMSSSSQGTAGHKSPHVNSSNEVHVSESKIAEWIREPPITRLDVRFTPWAEESLARFSKDSTDTDYRTVYLEGPEEIRAAVVSILSADPRSAYRRQHCTDRLYYFRMDRVHVTCWFNGDTAEVVSIKPNLRE